MIAINHNGTLAREAARDAAIIVVKNYTGTYPSYCVEPEDIACPCKTADELPEILDELPPCAEGCREAETNHAAIDRDRPAQLESGYG